MLLDKLTQKELSKLESAGAQKRYLAGETIIKEGEGGVSFSLILAGRVEVRKKLAIGQYKALVELGPCDLIGELGFLGADSRTASVVALTDCDMLEFNREPFEKFVDSNPAIGSKIYRSMAETLAKRLASNDETLMDTIFWALGRSMNQASSVDINIANRPKLVLKKI